MSNKTLFNAVFIRPEQVVRFFLCTRQLRVVENRIKQCCAANLVQCSQRYCSGRLQAGFRLINLFSIVDNIEQCGQHKIVHSCFQQPSTTRNFYACIIVQCD